ncbi:DNA polymerase III subunit gamma/tau [Desemzia sp. RIT804]|uniref:DNA polymerase III subunit gamma/tau n=1 Tax=Desemzia sp. RIT 804 TaxID=2810209 RepID=UPI0019509116|nr:DNA polymerase III subunit gamma/tau [Desemzia sp. RIT 804]MBM6616009.1 DNA polymerase III subunit gamma/tau [Desemzia sp. RIT 804]
MSYQALYRVWRPQRFQDIAGQTAITQTLRNALIQEKTSHAYLFTGPRGTGKTSAAKIFAKAINCPNLSDGEPCNECETCQAITTGQLNDVIEIDAASNNGVEEIRDIRDKAKYAPTQAEYKVYIIDEVHMLSTGAFNALLKTLEEPPKNVVFILATTEPHKIPLTIISRTQRFDFKRISVRDICDRMEYILGQEKIRFEDDSLKVIARAAEGGMRDALSILDQAISFGDDVVMMENAMAVTGSLTQERLIEFFNSIIQYNTEKGLSLVQEILAEGKDVARFVEDIILFSRDLLVYQQAPQKADILESAHVDESFVALSQAVDSQVLYEVISTLNETQREMRLTSHADVYIEVATVKLTQLRVAPTAAASLAGQALTASPEVTADSPRMSELEAELMQMKKKMQEMMANGSVQPAEKAKKKTQAPTKGAFKPNSTAIYKVLEIATKDDLVQLKDVWPDLLNMLSVTQRAVMKASTPVAASPNGLIVSFEYDILCQKATNDNELIEAVSEYLRRLIGHSPQMICVPAEQWPTIRSTYIKQNKDKMKAKKAAPNQSVPSTEKASENVPVQKGNQGDWESLDQLIPTDEEEIEEAKEEKDDPIVSQAMQMFGSEIVEVRND